MHAEWMSDWLVFRVGVRFHRVAVVVARLRQVGFHCWLQEGGVRGKQRTSTLGHAEEVARNAHGKVSLRHRRVSGGLAKPASALTAPLHPRHAAVQSSSRW